MMKTIGTDAIPIEVLVVEDSPGDVRLTREAFKDAKVHINLHVASDGTEAMAFLKHEGQHASAPRPDLILLDLNLPKKDGREVLADIKESPSAPERRARSHWPQSPVPAATARIPDAIPEASPCECSAVRPARSWL
jgi:CheY-like chemotaxis protein